jgi:hypothetical protein
MTSASGNPVASEYSGIANGSRECAPGDKLRSRFLSSSGLGVSFGFLECLMASNRHLPVL